MELNNKIILLNGVITMASGRFDAFFSYLTFILELRLGNYQSIANNYK